MNRIPLAERSDRPIAAVMPAVLDILSNNVHSGRWSRYQAHANSSKGIPLCQDEEQRLVMLAPYFQHEAIGELGLRLSQDRPMQHYLLKLYDTYLIYHPQVDGLLSGDEQLWASLHVSLARQAARHLGRSTWHFAYPGLDIDDAVQKSCMVILKGRYPYDVPFESWCGRILINVVNSSFQHSRDLHDRRTQLVSLEALMNRDGEKIGLSPWGRTGVFAQQAALFEWWQKQELRTVLEEALGRIRSDTRRRVLHATFFEGCQDDEIAQRLGRSRSNIQVIRHRGLQDMRMILEQELSVQGEQIPRH